MSYTTFNRTFPLPTCRHGLLLGNGLTGALVWGEANTLRITIGRPDFWDHRGGMPWKPGMSYARIRTLLEANDENGLRDIFENRGPDGERALRPAIVPVGRVEIELPASLSQSMLEPATGIIHLYLNTGAQYTLTMAPTDPILLLRGAADPALALAFRWDAGNLYLATDRGPEAPAAIREAAMLLAPAGNEGDARVFSDAGVCRTRRQRGSAGGCGLRLDAKRMVEQSGRPIPLGMATHREWENDRDSD